MPPSATRLALSESPNEPGLAENWVGRMLALGSRAARYCRKADGQQLIIAVSVPKRDFAAALIGCGWVLASEAPKLSDPLTTLREMKPGQPLRAVNSREIVTGFFTSLDERTNPPRAGFARSQWRVNDIRALAALDMLDSSVKEPLPKAGSLESMAGLDADWDARLALPAADLAIVGTVAWLEQDFSAYLRREGDGLPPSSIKSLLKPKESGAATWFTRLFCSAGLADHLPLPSDLNAVILDGNGAIKYLEEVETPVVICVLDRSVADETAAEIIIQRRNSWSDPICLSSHLSWQPPTGVEALAFTVPL